MIGCRYDTLVGGDFNCVENVETDTRKAEDEEGYGNAHGPKLRSAINEMEMGLIDAYNLVNGNAREGFTRLSGTIHTRIDKIYTPITCSNINWQTIGPHPALFTGKGASDHLPVLGTFEIVGYKSGRTYNVCIDNELFDSEEVRKVVSHLWKSHTNLETPDEDIDDAWGNAKRAVATYLLWATRQGKEHLAITRASPVTH